MHHKEFLRTGEQASTLAGTKSRRRPGRNDQVSPHLIPLLRDPATTDVSTPLPDEADAPPLKDDLAVAKGIMFCLALSVPLWTGIAGIMWAVLR